MSTTSLHGSSKDSQQDSPVKPPPFESLYIYLLLALMSFFVADVVLTSIRSSMLPTQAPAARTQKAKRTPRQSKSAYSKIARRNIFNQDGRIPPPLSKSPEEKIIDDGPAVPSQLPLNLIGTIVHFDERRSVATIQNRGNNKIKSYKPRTNIENIAEILSVERKKVIFRNLNNGRKEFIQIKSDVKINFGLSEKKSEDKEVKKEGNRFSIKRDDVLKYTKNLPELLQQARAVPNIIPGSGGRVDGFRILDMEKGSIFEKLGLKKLDVIKGVNGEPVDSPAKAMELYNALKNSQRIDLEIERGGQSENFNYIIE